MFLPPLSSHFSLSLSLSLSFSIYFLRVYIYRRKEFEEVCSVAFVCAGTSTWLLGGGDIALALEMKQREKAICTTFDIG